MTETLQFPVGRVAPAAAGRSILTCAGHDNTIRWRPGERLQHLFERRAATLAAAGHAGQPALNVDGVTVSFEDLDRRANRMARYFRAEGIGTGDRVGLIVDRSIESYVALLAVLKVEAAYVPLDAKFPADRIAFIAGDAAIKAFVVMGDAARLIDGLGLPVYELAATGAAAEAFDDSRFAGRSREPDQLCYIVYTSGSTGRPKGVAVNHSSICNFVQVATEVYGYRPGDRVYQGMTLAFDFSVEELWVPLLSGATLVPSPADRQMVGDDLARFLADHRVTALCCVPTLLATIDADLPDLRLLLVSGEACPPDIVARWQRPGRRMLNAYGPTEATVTATWTEVEAGRPVTIGGPLPTYTIAILDAGRDALAPDGAIGEIAIAGIGLAVGYVNRDDLTAKAFVPDFLQLAGNPSRRLYRTGDLGRITEAGEIEYLGRIDTQVKIRGYRIELAEIENVFLEIDGIAQAVVVTHEPEPGIVELAAYYTAFAGGPRPRREELLATLRAKLPGYMVPAYVEELDVMPLLPSHKADRKALPTPRSPRLVSRGGAFVAPRSPTEDAVAACLAETLKLDDVSVDDHFFDDLGAHSLLMGQFLARLNARMPRAKAAIADVYLEPTVARLAAELDQRAARMPAGEDVTSAVRPAHVASDADYVLCGVLQGLVLAIGYGFAIALIAAGLTWTSAAADEVQAMARAAAFSGGVLVASMALPIAAKWLLIGRWQAGEIPLWSIAYVRFWIVRQLTAASPWQMLQGTVLYNVYLRLLGARIGPGTLILTRGVPLATDLIQIGAGAVLRKNVHATGYRAEGGRMHIGAIDIGDNALVGEASLIDLGTSIGAGAELGHASALLEGQHIPAGKRYHGSPARETDMTFRRFEDQPTTWLRRTAYAGARLAFVVVMSTVVIWAFGAGAWSLSAGEGASTTAAELSLSGVAAVVLGSLAVFVVVIVVSLAVHLTVPRLLRALIKSETLYPLYGVRYAIAQAVAGMSLSPSFQLLFGDSSAIMHYLNWLGVAQPDARQTGSNFGSWLSFESATDLEFGQGSMVSDGLDIVNLDMGAGRFRLMPARFGRHSFVGNAVVLPPGARLGDNCLLATKVMVPIGGPPRRDVGLLGSPAFEIPREVASGRKFNPVPVTDAEKAALAAKNRFNLCTALYHLAARWTLLAGLAVLGYLAGGLFGGWSVEALVAWALAAPVYVAAHSILVERASMAGLRLEPHDATIHEPSFWWVERHWKLAETPLKPAFAGTPFRPVMLRLLGLRIGRKVFDDGAVIPENYLVEIGDGVCLNAAVAIQAHSLEDGLFKADRIVIGDGVTLSPGAFVHYGVAMGEGTVLSSDAFLMKGATTRPGSTWQGNPARPV